MNILFEGNFYIGTGYAEGNRALLLILNNLGYRVRILPLTPREKSKGLTEAEIQYLSSFEKTELTSNDIFLCRAPGDRLHTNPKFRINIGLTTFETDRIPKKWVPVLNKFDEVWVQTHFNLKTFTFSGVKVPIKVVPYFFNDSLFTPKGKKLPLPISNSFKFLSVFDLIERKGYDLLLKAYLNEFSKKDDVALVIKTRDRKSTHKLKKIIKNHRKPREKRAPIHIIDKMLMTPDILSLYRACNAFVLPTRGEGWGRPFYESMLMEMPAIGTDWSGQREYMNEENSFLIRVKRLVPVKIKSHPNMKKYKGKFLERYKGHRWAEPSIGDLQNKMRYVVEHREKAVSVGRKARQYLLENYSMQEVARQVAKEIEKFRK